MAPTPDDDRIAPLNVGALQIRIRDPAGKDSHAPARLIRPALLTHGAAFAALDGIERCPPLHLRPNYHRPMPETPEQLYRRSAQSLRMPPVEEWETFPF